MQNEFAGVVAGALALFALSGVIHAQSASDIVGNDQARWAAIHTESMSYRKAPSTWEDVREENTKISASFPCHPQRFDRATQGRQRVVFACKAGDETYTLTVGIGLIHDDSKAGLEQAFAGVDYSVSNGLQKRFGTVSVDPQKYVVYSGFNGRQTYFDAGAYELVSRVVVLNGNLCEMTVSGPKGKPAGQGEVFFNALALR